uniref:NADAR protein n=1 Tax=Clandestinovirus TaxID=2831644 RepID=A0A8F8KRA3_9VIRU|nr:NADAR protein [Clandestinovirus]
MTKHVKRNTVHYKQEMMEISATEVQQVRQVYFYSPHEKPFGVFSNFALYPVTIQGKTYKTTEHYFQSQKFVGTTSENDVIDAPTPAAAAAIGRDRKRPLRPDWEQVKDDVMRVAVLAKFQQYTKLKDILLATGDVQIVEHTKKDKYWGDGGDGTGLNRLGQILMQVRYFMQHRIWPANQHTINKIQNVIK